MKSKIIDAVYEKGVFRPLKKVRLKEGERVKIRIEKGNLLSIVSKYQKLFRLSKKDVDEYIRNRR